MKKLAWSLMNKITLNLYSLVREKIRFFFDMFRILKSIIYHEIVHSILRILKAEVIISTGFLS